MLFLYVRLCGQEVDLSAIGIDSLSHALYQKIDFSVACIQWPYRLVVPWPKEETRLLAPIRPFQPLVSHSITTHILMY